jgi:hypothetical protein
MKGRSTSPGKTRDGRAAIDPVAEPHEALLTDENPQYARNPILAAEVPEFPTHAETRHQSNLGPLESVCRGGLRQ